MARKKVNVRYIRNGSTRKETGKKRTMGLVKKAAELSTLCDIDVVLAVFPEGESSSSSPAVVYPSSRPETMRIVDRFNSMPEHDQRKNKMDGEGHVRERMRKVQEQLRKAESDNRRRETLLLLHGVIAGLRPRNLEGLAVEQLASVGWTAENLMKKIKDSIETYRSGGQQAGSVMPDDQGPTHAAAVADVEATTQIQHGWESMPYGILTP